MHDYPSGSQRLDDWFRDLAPQFAGSTTCAPENAQDEVDDSEHPATTASPSRPVTTLLDSIVRRAMACEFEVLMNRGQYAASIEAAVAALELIEQLENLLSVYKTRSDLSTVNRFAHARPIAVSHDTAALLRLAIDLHALTGGTFDITAGSLTEAWGFSRRAGSLPTQAEIDAALTNVGTDKLRLDRDARQVFLKHAGVKVNPGGIGKGYALDRAAGLLEREGIHDFVLHGGLSSIVARGDRQHPEAGSGWSVTLKHPWRVEAPLGTLRLNDQALGTSGSGKQFFHFGGKRYSHIIDPRSGWPAQGMMSATVICRSGAVADALATALFVMGPEHAVRFCEAHPAIGAVLIFSDPKNNQPRLLTCNLAEGQWQPIAATRDE